MKISTLPEFIYKFMQPRSNPMEFFFEIYIITVKFICRMKEKGMAIHGKKKKLPTKQRKFQGT